jgi:hypothetical protein
MLLKGTRQVRGVLPRFVENGGALASELKHHCTGD